MARARVDSIRTERRAAVETAATLGCRLVYLKQVSLESGQPVLVETHSLALSLTPLQPMVIRVRIDDYDGEESVRKH